MKKSICYLLVVWLALVSGGANALSAHDAGHDKVRAAHTQSASGDTSNRASKTDTGHTESCNHSHCGHGHTTGLLMLTGISHTDTVTATLPVAHSCWASAATANNIERPKWPVTTPAVVSLLA